MSSAIILKIKLIYINNCLKDKLEFVEALQEEQKETNAFVKRNLDTQAKITKEMRKVLSNRIDDNKARDVQISKMEGIIAGMEETVEELVDFKNINLTCRPMDPFQA